MKPRKIFHSNLHLEQLTSTAAMERRRFVELRQSATQDLPSDVTIRPSRGHWDKFVGWRQTQNAVMFPHVTMWFGSASGIKYLQNVIQFDPIWSYSIQFDPIWSYLIKKLTKVHLMPVRMKLSPWVRLKNNHYYCLRLQRASLIIKFILDHFSLKNNNSLFSSYVVF